MRYPLTSIATQPPALRPLSDLVPFLAGLCLLALPVSAQSLEPPSDRGLWHTAAPAPTKRTEVVAVALGDKIYVVGGFEQPRLSNLTSLAITPLVEEYDPAADRWAAKAPLPTPRGALSVTECDGKLYTVGEYDGKANSIAVEVYDPAQNTWASLAPLPIPRDHLATATVSGKVYAIGGRLNGDYRRNLSVMEVYDPATDRWKRAADLPTARSGITASVVDGRIYVFGGEGGEGTFRENEAYDPARDTWQTMAPMPAGRHGLGSAAVRGRIHVISGGPTPGGSFSNLNEVFTPPVPVTSK